MSEPAFLRRGLGDVIPVPADVRPDPAADFTIGAGTAIRTAPGSAAAARIGEHLAALLRPATGYALPRTSDRRDPVARAATGADSLWRRAPRATWPAPLTAIRARSGSARLQRNVLVC